MNEVWRETSRNIHRQLEYLFRFLALIFASVALFSSIGALNLRSEIQNLVSDSLPHSFEGGHGFAIGFPLIAWNGFTTVAAILATGCLLAQRVTNKRMMNLWNITSVAFLAVALLTREWLA